MGTRKGKQVMNGSEKRDSRLGLNPARTRGDESSGVRGIFSRREKNGRETGGTSRGRDNVETEPRRQGRGQQTEEGNVMKRFYRKKKAKQEGQY